MADVKLEGMEELLTEMNKLGEAGEKIEKTVLVKAGKKVQEAIIKEAPQRSGKLKKSIKVSRIKRLDGASFIEVYPSGAAYYSKFLEFGTSKMKADPFMSRGYEASKDEVENLIAEEIRKGLGL